MTTTEIQPEQHAVEAFAGRLMAIITDGMLAYMIDIGHRTGLFDTFVGVMRRPSSPGTPLRAPNSSARSAPM